jgi:RNA polymerase sigma factor (sigma-70 family)
MSWRKFPLPLLMLTVALTPAEASRGLQAAGAGRGESQIAPAGALSTTSPRRRRAEEQTSEESLRQVSDYLRCLAEGRQPSAELAGAWASFHASCDSSIQRFATHCGLRGADVDDCTQDVWLDLMQSLPDFRLDASRGTFSSWLYRIVHSKAVDMQRRQARRPAGSFPDALSESLADAAMMDPSAGQEREEACQAVRLALSQLQQDASEDSYQVLKLRQIDGWSVPQVAETLGLTPEQVWAREHRMKRKLQQLLERGADAA